MKPVALFSLVLVVLSVTELAMAKSSPEGASPIVIDKRIATGAQRNAAVSALTQKARQRGRVRVIVGLTTSMHGPDEVSTADAARESRDLRITQESVARRVSGKVNVTGVVNFEHIPFMSMHVDAAQVGRLLADPAIVTIAEDAPLPPVLTKSVPFINSYGPGLPGVTGKGLYAVAILDTGVDRTHKMFPGDKIVREACFSTNDPGTSISLCPGRAQTATGRGTGVNCPLSVENCYHGTHVAGIAAGNMASPRLQGVAPNSPIIAVQVFSRFGSLYCASPPCALSYTTDQIRALEWVYKQRKSIPIAAVNISLGGGLYASPCDLDDLAYKAAIDLLRGAHIATVIAAGNNYADGLIARPACVSSAIAVGATLHTENEVADYSNLSPMVRMLAPGSGIVSAVPPGPTTTETLSGTSMAAPHVAGAFALLREAKRNATVDDISAALECTGVAVKRAGTIERRIDIVAARKYLLNPPMAQKSFDYQPMGRNQPIDPRKGWTSNLGTWSVSNGRYRTTNSSAGWHLTTVANCNESLTITSRQRRVWRSGQTNNAGIAFKAQFSGSNNLSMSGYMAAVSRDTSTEDRDNVVLWRLDAYGLKTAEGAATLLCSADYDAVKSGAIHTLKVVSHGGEHGVFVDGTKRCTANDTTYGTGRTGLITFFASPAAGNVFEADQFTVVPNEVSSASQIAAHPGNAASRPAEN